MSVTRTLFVLVLLPLAICPVTASAQLNKADEYIKAGNYPEAASLLEGFISKGMAGQPALIDLAFCYIKMHDHARAEVVYQKLIPREKPHSLQYFYYGEVLRYLKKYDEARMQYAYYLEHHPDDHYAKNCLISCDSLKRWDQINTEVSCRNAAEINTPFDEICPVAVGEKLYYLSNKHAVLLKNMAGSVIADTGLYSVFIAGADGVEADRSFGDSVSYQSLSIRDGMFAIGGKPVSIAAGGLQFGLPGIFIRGKNHKWSRFVPAETPETSVINHPCIARSGNRIYFAGDIPGGLGGTDLYYADFNGEYWTKAINLGSVINTPGNEMFPVISAEGDTLYFSSDGHPGYGNLDIFRSTRKGFDWGVPINQGSPVNSEANDFGFIFAGDYGKACFASNRHRDSKGGYDIFYCQLGETRPVILPEIVEEVKLPSLPSDTIHVFYRTASAEIDSSFGGSLDHILQLLRGNPEWKLNIVTWADTRGSGVKNMNLCMKRIFTISNWFITRGIDSTRMLKYPSGETGSPVMKQIRYHVQLGYVKKDNEHDYFRRKAAVAEVKSFRGKNGIYYYTGQGSMEEMSALAALLQEKTHLKPIVAGFYNNYYIPESRFAPFRRADLYFTR
ncbi:MAG TPA: hypothetical protein P5531_05540 [Bacteroidales bacterium]|nr:hypothetical protein [Bacteroidales bacterium]HSA42870.1 hypothetical protein [Bacteroidales bacterium]